MFPVKHGRANQRPARIVRPRGGCQQPAPCWGGRTAAGGGPCEVRGRAEGPPVPGAATAAPRTWRPSARDGSTAGNMAAVTGPLAVQPGLPTVRPRDPRRVGRLPGPPEAMVASPGPRREQRWRRDMAERFRAAPFPLYGLPASWTGPRHLGGEGSRQARGQPRVVTSLTLAHGDPAAGHGHASGSRRRGPGAAGPAADRPAPAHPAPRTASGCSAPCRGGRRSRGGRS